MTRAWAFLLLAAGIAIATVQLTNIRTNIGDFFFSGTADDSGYRIGQIQSQKLARRYLISIAHPDINETTVREFTTTLKQTLAESEQIRRVWAEPFSQTDILQLLLFYAPHQLQLLSLQPEHEVSRLLSPTGMASQADTIKAALLGPDPSLVKSLLVDDPMLLTLAWFTQASQAYKQPDIDPAFSAFFLETQHAGLDTLAQQDFQQTLIEIFSTLNNHYEKGFTLEMTGVPVFATSIQAQVKHDITRISTLSIGLVTLLFWLVFRSLRALLCISRLPARPDTGSRHHADRYLHRLLHPQHCARRKLYRH
jgi:predicted exporter